MATAIQFLVKGQAVSLWLGALLVSSVAAALLIVAQLAGRGVNELDAGLVYVLFTLLVAVNFGLKPGLAAGAFSTVLVNYFFLQPIFGFAMDQPQHVLSLPVFLIVPVIGASLAEAAAAQTGAKQPSSSGGFPHPELEIDPESREVFVDGVRVRLTPTELRLLQFFAQNPERVLLSQEILQHVWGEAYTGDPRILRTYVNQLRSKLGDNRASPRFIDTQPGFGYRFLTQQGSVGR